MGSLFRKLFLALADFTALKAVSLMELFYSAGSLLEMTVWTVSMNEGIRRPCHNKFDDK